MNTTDWVDYPEFKEFKSFDEIQDMYNRLGLDFIKIEKTRWNYNIPKEDFKKKVDGLNLNVNDGRTKEEKWIIKEVLNESNLISREAKGVSFIRQ